MIGCLRTRVRKQPIIALYFESETVLRFFNLEAWLDVYRSMGILIIQNSCSIRAYSNNDRYVEMQHGPCYRVHILAYG